MHESTRDMYDGTIVNLWIEFHKDKKKERICRLSPGKTRETCNNMLLLTANSDN